MIIPDVVGQELDKALIILSNYSFQKVFSTPPWDGLGQGKIRVIRQRYIKDKTVELVLSYDIYLKK